MFNSLCVAIGGILAYKLYISDRGYFLGGGSLTLNLENPIFSRRRRWGMGQ